MGFILFPGLGSLLAINLWANAAVADVIPSFDPMICQSARFSTPSAAAIRELSPTGKLRVAINTGNYVLANERGDFVPYGISVDIAHFLEKQLKVTADFVVVKSAAESFERVSQNQSDIGFFGVDPWRGKHVSYTQPYIQIEGSYIVRADSPFKSLADVDRPGVEIVVGKNSVYNLFLERNIRQAGLIQAPTSPEVTSYMLAHNYLVGAGIRNQLEADSKRLGGLRILPEPFMTINQSIATGQGRPEGLDYLQTFIRELKTSGCVQELITKYAVESATVAK
ncbi:periplasmic component of amino acid ABC-type transporter/signal transduction system [Synechococcus sp. PCC 7502]|uniref:ABC transporter substrate-binding protein n=1 Tax=Synechococcus sp. PCC 7502 TaxID=1173263 RepID=UPI00029F9A75|nr:ABC transporter substrate-binding protein [Synechococcus sp. PCC 7502]AFY75037.1 periplasmic component of amino acid ABC-type transporter/signal transduction system [Synechococcus sp. PCC 7502]